MHALSSLTVIPASRFALSPCRGGASLRAARSPLDACSGPAPASRARCMGGDAQSGGGGSSGAESSAKAVAGARTARGSGGAQVMELRVDEIRRPLMRTRSNDQEKVAALMASIKEIGLQEPASRGVTATRHTSAWDCPPSSAACDEPAGTCSECI
ncbi:unnamed protein product [Closterium sp. NIES-65]|nr:unnamed protein product [Closterium sp. NIES-65]